MLELEKEFKRNLINLPEETADSFIEDIALLPEDETLINQHQQLFKALCEKITRHMQHEETHIFPQLMAQLTNEQHEQLASAYIDKCRELNKTQTKRVI